MRWIGLREGAALAAATSLALAAWGWVWPVAVWWGLGSVAAARAARALIDRNTTEQHGLLWPSIAALATYALTATMALGGVRAGLPALGVVAGLVTATVGVWARVGAIARSV